MTQTLYGPMADATVTATEQYGVVNAMVAKYMITGTSGSTVSANIAAALADASLPAYNSSPAGYPNLKCISRTITNAPDNPHVYYVECKFVATADSDANFIFEAGASLNQTTTERSWSGIPIVVAHTFPADDPDWPSQYKEQGCTISVLRPELTVTATGILSKDYPLNFESSWIGRTNSTPWYQGPAGYWLCTDIGHKLIDASASPKKYQFKFTFQCKQDPWNPVATFIDPRTGQPPSGLVAGTGYYEVPSYPSRDFNELFPST